MNPIKLNKAIPELGDQLSFLIRREFYVTYYKFRNVPIYLVSLTAIVVAIATLTDPNFLIAFKAVSLTLIVITWLVAFMFLIPALIKRYKRRIWRQKTLRATFSNDSSFQFAFDDEKLYFVTDTYSTEIKWDYYKYYATDKNSIFIFPPLNIYEALYYSKNELGIENYERLYAIASEKLVLLDAGNGT